MVQYLLRRLLLLIPTLLVMSMIVFLMVRLLPGDIIDIYTAGDLSITPEQREQIKEELGLSGSYAEQYWNWISGAVQGDFGTSLRNTTPVSEMLLDALPITIELVVMSLIISTAVGIPLGVISAVRRDSSHDYASRVGGLIGVSIPSFWLATLLLLFTSRVFEWVPPFGYVSPLDDPWVNFQQFILPSISISVFTMAIVMRMVRATMLEVLSLDYIRTARAKGVAWRRVVFKHALRNALIPVVTIVGFEVGILMSGAAIVEIIFGLPGVGWQLLQAVFNRDYPMVQATALLLATIFVMVNLVVDVIYSRLDPRITLD